MFTALVVAVLGALAPSPVTLHGAVRDATRAPIVGAHITAMPAQGAHTVSSVTDARGEFTLALEAGRYTLTVAADGFLDSSRGITAGRAGLGGAEEFVLQVAGFRDTVNVTAPPSYKVGAIGSGTKTLTPLRDVPQSITVVTRELMKDQLMTSMPGYTRVDAAAYLSVSKTQRLQVNVENLFNTTYYANADSNTNISPGFPRAVRIGWTARF